MSESTLAMTVPNCQNTILGLPILHLALTQSNPPQTQLMKMGIAPIAAELCSSQTFAGRISLFQLNWKALTSDSWVLETVTGGITFHFYPSLFSKHPPQPPLTSRGSVGLGGGGQVTLAETDDSTSPHPSSGILFQHVHGAQERWSSETCYQPQTLEPLCEISAFQDGRPTHSQGPPPEK